MAYKLKISNWSNENMKTSLCSSYPASSQYKFTQYKSIASTLPLHKNPLLNNVHMLSFSLFCNGFTLGPTAQATLVLC